MATKKRRKSTASKRRKPFVVFLGGHPIEVRWVKGLIAREHCDGQWFHGDMRIELDADLPEDHALETLIHECAHAVSDLLFLKLSENKVRQLGFGLHSMLREWFKPL